MFEDGLIQARNGVCLKVPLRLPSAYSNGYSASGNGSTRSAPLHHLIWESGGTPAWLHHVEAVPLVEDPGGSKPLDDGTPIVRDPGVQTLAYGVSARLWHQAVRFGWASYAF